jgi:hypothetical protein
MRSARSRPGTSPSFWRAYHRAQFGIAASSTRITAAGIAKVPSTREMIAEYEKTKKPAPSHFVCVGR